MTARIRAAAAAIDPLFLNSPEFTSDAIDRVLGLHATFKLETQNPLRSFKGRGADWLLQNLPPDKTIVTASAGNFGAAVAYAAQRHGHSVHVFASTNASPLKIGTMRRLGATVTLEGRDLDDAKSAAMAFAGENGGRFVEDGAEPEIAEGAGTIAMELSAGIDTVVVPVGNGALISGIGEWMKAERPSVRVIGVCAAGAPAMRESWLSGSLVRTEFADTIADGIAVRNPVPLALQSMRTVVDDMLLVDDTAIAKAMLLFRDELEVTLEPAGAVAVAAALSHRFAERTVAFVLTGANVEVV